MTKASDFKVLSIQTTLFTPYILFSVNKIFENIMSKFSSYLDGDTVSIPLPPEAPKEIPRIILPSAKGDLKIEIAESRINCFKYRQEDEEEVDEKEFLQLCFKIFKEYLNCSSAVVGRVALVTVKFVEDDDPSRSLARHFCKERFDEEPFNRPSNFELHSHKVYSFSDFTVNSWVRCKTGKMKKEDRPIMVVQEDINTLQEQMEQNDFKMEDIRKFTNMAIKEQEAILKKYFPNNE